jgi:hypothetical protein
MAAAGPLGAVPPAAALLFTAGTLDATTRNVTWLYQVRAGAMRRRRGRLAGS